MNNTRKSARILKNSKNEKEIGKENKMLMDHG
jgi:hypothetical protein